MKDKQEITEELEEKALVVIEGEKLLQYDEKFKEFLELQRQLSEKKEELKKYLKENMLKYDIDTITSPKGESDWTIKLSKRQSVQVEDLDLIEEEYLDYIPLENVVEVEGNYYQLTGNTKLAKAVLDSGSKLPNGFTARTIPALSIKLNGKAI